jgi:hypothetical protein
MAESMNHPLADLPSQSASGVESEEKPANDPVHQSNAQIEEMTNDDPLTCILVKGDQVCVSEE